jgi:class 3 adenylate cyclase/tetratricopeptide (TPR) repeat protein
MVDLKSWLEELGMGQYAQSFAANDIDFDVLPDLTEAELERLGVSLGHRKRLRRAITALTSTANKNPAAATPTQELQAERRQVTVMFCDLVGSTEMSTRLDPEELRDMVRAYQQICTEAIGRFEGFVAQYLGDGILAYFGYPSTHEGEAERAVRAGLAALASANQISAKAAAKIQIRIGIATGPAVIGDMIGRGTAMQIAVTGKTPNLAARIQEFAPPGTLAIAQSTQRLVATQFECRPLGTPPLKGISETIPLFQVVRELTDAEQFDAGRKRLLDCVGRDRELKLLLDRWQLTCDGSGQAVAVSGEAGIGKTRLVALLREQLAAGSYLSVRLQCAQQYRNSPLQPVIVQMRRAAALDKDDTPAAQLAKIEQLLTLAGNKDGVPLVASLLSIPFEDRYPSLAMPAVRQRAETLELLVGQVFGLARDKPVLLTVEDAHWIDPSTEETLTRLLDRLQHHRVMVLVTARPDSASRLVDHPRAMTLVLGRLDPDQVKQMISAVTGDSALSPEVMDQIVQKTDGVPLFIEELTKDVLETKQRSNRPDVPLSNLAIPSTLEDTLRARIDRLAAVKDVAQVAAALGRSFAYSIIGAVLNQDEEALRLALDRLVEAKLIYQHGAPPEAVYAFKHVLVQDAAYESLLRSQRVALHARIVSVIEKQFSTIADDEPELVAHHCSRAELGEKAVDYWLKAGAKAVSRSANVEAISHLRNGLQGLPAIASEQDRTRIELALQLTLGQALIAARGYTAVETTQAFARAEQLVEKIGDTRQRYSALYGIFVGHLIAGRIDLASETIARMYQLSRSDEDNSYVCLAYRLRGSLSFFRGDLEASEEELEKSVALFSPQAQQQLASQFGPDTGSASLIFLAMTQWLRGKPDRAFQSAQNAIAQARQVENALTLGQVLALAAQLHYMGQDYESMLSLSKEGGDNCERVGILYFGSICRAYQTWAQARHADPADYIDEFKQCLTRYETLKSGLQLGLFHVMLAQLLLAAGRRDEAVKESEAALVKIAVNGERWWAPEIYRTLGLALAKSDPQEASKNFHRAIAEARRTGALMLELRATTNLVQNSAGMADAGSTKQMLASVLQQFTEGGESADVSVARTLLEGIPTNRTPSSPGRAH